MLPSCASRSILLSTYILLVCQICHSLLYLQVAPEPVDRWQNVNASNGVSYNLLDQFYHDKERYAYIFQNYIFFTRMMQARLQAALSSFTISCISHFGGVGLFFVLQHIRLLNYYLGCNPTISNHLKGVQKLLMEAFASH